MPTLSEIQNHIYFTFTQKIYEDLKGDEPRRKEIHVSDLVYDCLRRGYLAIKRNIYLDDIDTALEIDIDLNEKKLMTFWIGKKLHELALTPWHHKRFEYGFWDKKESDIRKVHAEVDEVFKYGDHYIVMDKKTCRKFPRGKGYYVHHKLQVEYYGVLLWLKFKIKAKYGAITYINVATPEMRVVPFLMRDLDERIEEMKEKVDLLATCLEEDVPPPPCKGWICKYCMFYEQCIKIGV